MDDLDFTLDFPEVTGDEIPTITIDADIIPADDSGSVDGQNLWKMGVFGSQNPDGSGPKVGEQEQILGPDQLDESLISGQPLSLDNITTEFDTSLVGCADFKYMCVEFSKGENPSADFEFETTEGDSIVRCQKVPCQASK